MCFQSNVCMNNETQSHLKSNSVLKSCTKVTNQILGVYQNIDTMIYHNISSCSTLLIHCRQISIFKNKRTAVLNRFSHENLLHFWFIESLLQASTWCRLAWIWVGAAVEYSLKGNKKKKMAQGGGLANSREKHVKDALSNFKSNDWAHFGFYYTDSGTTLDKEFPICKNCLAKVTGNTTNMHSHLVCHHPELAVEERTVCGANANVSVTQPSYVLQTLVLTWQKSFGRLRWSGSLLRKSQWVSLTTHLIWLLLLS